MPAVAPPLSFASALRLWWRLGWLSFGGPAGQIALMHTELVERRGWVREDSFLHGLNYSMLLPGPEATQLAMFLGWKLHGFRGGLCAGALFVLPGALVTAALAWVYIRIGEAPLVGGLLLGLQAAVLGIVMYAVIRIGARVLHTAFARGLAIGALLAIGVASVPFPLVVAIAACAGALAGRWRAHWLPAPPVPALELASEPKLAAPRSAVGAASTVQHRWRTTLAVAAACLLAWWLPVALLVAWLGTASTAVAQALFFSKAAVVTFGGAYAVLPYVAQQAVEVHGWLDAGQMMVGLGLAEATPGPLVLVLEFVGFLGGWHRPDLDSSLASALLCATVTLWVTFVPSALFVLPAAPWIEGLQRSRVAAASLAAITSAVVGVIAYLGLWFGWQLMSGAGMVERGFVSAVAALVFWALVRGGSVLWLVPASAIAGLLAAVMLPSG